MLQTEYHEIIKIHPIPFNKASLNEFLTINDHTFTHNADKMKAADMFSFYVILKKLTPKLSLKVVYGMVYQQN